MSVPARAIPFAVMLALLWSLAGCSTFSSDASDEEAPDPVAVTGTVQFLNLEGGCWAITVGDTTYEPINLPEDFKQDGLPVRAVVREQEDMASFCQIGPIVEVERIERQ